MGTPERDETLLGAGDRAPDAPMTGQAGQPVRAFELCKGPHWTLLGYEVPRAVPFAARTNLHIHRVAQDGDVIDTAGALRAAYGLNEGDWVLVRPDGYVGAILGSRDAARLEGYLAKVGLSPAVGRRPHQLAGGPR